MSESHHSGLRGKVRLFGHFVPVQSLLLLAAESSAFFVLALSAASWVSGRTWTDGPVLLGAALFSVLLVLALAALGLYSAHQRAEFGGVVSRALIGALGVAASFPLWEMLAPALFDGWWLPALALSLGAFAVLRFVHYRYVDGALFARRVLVLGTGAHAHSIERLRRRSDQRGFRLVGFVDLGEDEPQVSAERILRPQGRLCDFALEQGVDEIVVAIEDRRQGRVPTEELLDCRMSGMDVTDLMDFFERETGKIRLDLLRPSWLIHSDGFKSHPARDAAKRMFDIVLSVLLLVVSLPAMLAVAAAIRIESGGRGTILYRQTRVGLGGRPFELLKFRSMREDAEKNGPQWASENDSRVTRVGRVIRKFRLDELPQLWNVLRNDMSLVGPRPERPEFVARLTRLNPLYRERHRVKPGLTGWAQIRYPYGATDEESIEKLQYDLYYVKNHRLMFDLYILLQTVEVVLFKVGSR